MLCLIFAEALLESCAANFNRSSCLPIR
jgi:hypothetical protein